jgi:hypothetical protein
MDTLKNRDYLVPKSDETIFAECKHCSEPFTYVGAKPTGHIDSSYNTDFKLRVYCRGADGLSWNVRCCLELKCKDCSLIGNSKLEYPAKFWNSIVTEPDSAMQ